MTEDQAKQAIDTIQGQLDELLNLHSEARDRNDFAYGRERMKRWVDRTAKQLARVLSEDEVNKFLECFQRVFSPYPDRAWQSLVEGYANPLLALRESLGEHPDDHEYAPCEWPQPKKPLSATAIDQVEKVLQRFHHIALQFQARRSGRPPLCIEDEFDVHYLLKALLKLEFEEVIAEDAVPTSVGGASRIDFVLKDERIGIEAKMTRPDLRDKEVGEELLTDIGRYPSHPDCDTLVCFVYDPKNLLRQPNQLAKDLRQKTTADLEVRVVIVPVF